MRGIHYTLILSQAALIARSSAEGLPRRSRMNFEPNSLFSLEIADDIKQVTSLRIPGWPEHPHQALGRVVRASCQFVKAYCGVNVIAQHSFARIYVPREKALDCFTQ